MSIRRIARYFLWAFLAVILVGVPIKSQFVETTASSTNTIIAGRNVNMVSGTKLPFGDPWLQRQNEPSIAVSTRNPMHLLAGANDYRTIDVPDQFELPGIQGAANAHDAWLGVYESFDGGQSWITTLLHGYPQDLSLEGLASPIHGFETACDPIVRAGANGLFYYCGIAFNRTTKASAIFVARYVDNNNLEKVEVKEVITGPGTSERKYFGPIQYIDTKLVATGSTSSSFIDMPNMAVDVPRKGALYGNVYVAYTVFENNVKNKIFFQRSTDGGAKWSASPVQLSTTGQLVQRPVIAIDPSDLKGNTIYVAFRRFVAGLKTGGIVVVRSTDGGKTFSKLTDVAASFYPFDQGTSNVSFRTNSYPTMAIDGLGTVYVAWSQRQGNSPTGQAKIMISAFKKGGLVWSTPKVVDQTYTGIGHQFMPSLTYAAWKLMLAWYDQREDPAKDASQFIEDSPVEHRHTIDVRAAEGTPGVPPSFSPSIQLSRYLYVLELDSNGNPIPEGDYYKVFQAESNHLNYPLFQLGTVPFHGDYLEITPSSRILPPAVAFGFWIYNINPLEPTNFHTAWTDNRNVRPPNGDMWGDWINYSAPDSIQDPGWEGPTCSNGPNTGMRNQNVYTANINKGIIMGSPGNTKQLDLPSSGEGGRTFVVFIKNTTALEKRLNLLILEIGGVKASFDQFKNDDLIQVKVEPYSSVSCSVYVDRSTRKLAPVTVNAFEGLKLVGYVILNPDPTNLDVSDPDNPQFPLLHETHNPDVSAPAVWNYDVGSLSDPNPSAVLNPRVKNEGVQNYDIVNPRVKNEDVLNPRVKNESIVNNEVANPRVKNTVVPNGALTDVTWTVTNEGNTTSAYTVNIVSNPDGVDLFNQNNPPLIAQVVVYKVHKVPVDKDCQLYETHQDELMVNIANPRVKNPRVQNSPLGNAALSTLSSSMSAQAADLSAQDVTFNLAPGDQADVIFRVWDEDTTVGVLFNPNMVSAEAVAEAVNTDDVIQGKTTPPYDTPPNPTPWTTPSPQISTLPSPLTGMSFSASLGGGNPPPQNLEIWNSGGDNLSYTIENDANWLSVDPVSGTSTGIHNVHQVSAVNISELAVGTYTGTITIRDPLASNNPLRIPVTLTISSVVIPAEWTNRYSNAGYSCQAVAMAVDSSGNTFVTGIRSTPGGEGSYTDYCTIEINNLGEFVWEKIFDRGPSDEPAAIVVAPDGNIIVTGSCQYVDGETILGYDFVTIKYNKDTGVQMWTATYDRLGSGGGGDDMAKALAVDSAGNVYVTGSSTNILGHYDFATIKYGGSNGSPLWLSSPGTEKGAVIYTGNTGGTPSEGEDEPVAIAVDPDEDCVVVGSSETSYGADYATLKYNSSDGSQIWEFPNGGEHTSITPYAMALDSDGNVLVTGSCYGEGALDYFTIKINGLNGVFVWDSMYDGHAEDDVPTAIAVDSSGDVYVTGYSLRTPVEEGVYFQDYATIKLNGTNGYSVWTARYSGPGGEDFPVAIAVDSSKNVYVTGYGWGLENYDYVTVRYDSDGNELWVRRYDSFGADQAEAMALDSSGSLYVTGTSQAETNTDYLTIKYDPAKPLLGLVGYYPFNGNANDASGYGHNGTEQGEGIALAQDRFGNQDSAYDFDGSEGYIDMGDVEDFNFGTGDFTLETWIQMDPASEGPRHIVGKRRDTEPEGNWARLYSLDEDGGAHIHFEFTPAVRVVSPSTYNDNQWHHLVGTRSSGTTSLYIDGQSVGSGTAMEDVSNDASFKIGKWSLEPSFRGKIDDIRIYNRALSAAEIAEHYLR
jgi:uncharacterized delta-60 repeat protein